MARFPYFDPSTYPRLMAWKILPIGRRNLSLCSGSSHFPFSNSHLRGYFTLLTASSLHAIRVNQRHIKKRKDLNFQRRRSLTRDSTEISSLTLNRNGHLFDALLFLRGSVLPTVEGLLFMKLVKNKTLVEVLHFHELLFPTSLTSAAGSEAMTTVLRRWLVDHPAIVDFAWTPSQTFAASPVFLASAILLYLTLTFLLPKLLHSSKPFPPAILRPISAVHNLTLTLLSLAMSIGCSLATLSQFPDRRSLFCLPVGTPPAGPVFFWAYLFYLSKYLELVDTLLIILGGTASRRRLSFLHVYHHATVLVMCYLWLETRQSLFPIALVTNASVHVVMYSYYFLSGIGIRPRWKRAVTDCQIVQFVFSFAVSGVMLWEHFVREGCSGFSGWCFNAVFNASLLALFVDFHGKSYARAKNEKEGAIRDEKKSKRL